MALQACLCFAHGQTRQICLKLAEKSDSKHALFYLTLIDFTWLRLEEIFETASWMISICKKTDSINFAFSI